MWNTGHDLVIVGPQPLGQLIRRHFFSALPANDYDLVTELSVPAECRPVQESQIHCNTTYLGVANPVIKHRAIIGKVPAQTIPLIPN